MRHCWWCRGYVEVDTTIGAAENRNGDSPVGHTHVGKMIRQALEQGNEGGGNQVVRNPEVGTEMWEEM